MAVFDFGVFRLLFVLVSTIFFYILSNMFRIFKPKSVALKNTWKWKNFSTSFVHSTMTGIGSVICFLENPHLTDDIKHSSTQFSTALVCASLGYFLYDMISVLLEGKTSENFGIIAHHIVMILNFAVPATLGLYTYYATVSLLLEINSIFLHLRMLLKLSGVPKNSSTHRAIIILNFGTFIPFRAFPVIWMGKWLYMNRHIVELYPCIVGMMGLAGIPVLNGVMLYRLIKTDILKSESPVLKSE